MRDRNPEHFAAGFAVVLDDALDLRTVNASRNIAAAFAIGLNRASLLICQNPECECNTKRLPGARLVPVIVQLPHG